MQSSIKTLLTKYCVAGNENVISDNNANKIVFSIKDIILIKANNIVFAICSCSNDISKRLQKIKLSKLFTKEFERRIYWNA